MAEFLRARNEWDNTLVIVTADHGDDLGGHGRLGHRLGLYDTLIRLPLLLRCPGSIPQGFVIDEVAQTTDILPTILALAGIPDDSEGIQGRPLLEDGRATRGPEMAISERFRPDLSAVQRHATTFDARPFDVRSKAIRTKRAKYVWRSDEANELYDLRSDPAETQNLIDRNQSEADQLRRQLFDWLATVGNFEADESATSAGATAPARAQGQSGQ